MRPHFALVFALCATLAACGPGAVDEGPGVALETSEASTTATTSTTTTASTATTEPNPTSETQGETSGGFVPMNDYPDPNSCDVFQQDCEAGEKCVPYASTQGTWDAFKCVPVLGDNATGEPCSFSNPVDAIDDCDASGYCWDVGPDSMGWCRAFCTGSADDPTCAEGSSCLISGGGVPVLCLPSCDPLAQDCGAGGGCYWTSGDFNCTNAGDLPMGEACGFIADCEPGMLCVHSDALASCEGSNCCTNFCSLEAGDGACAWQPGAACVPFFEQGAAPPGFEDVGVCVLP